jgi:Peptide methionine sulfoxide reductase
MKELAGVNTVTSGYAGGDIDNPTYKQVCSGTTDHAEVVQIEYDPTKIEYSELLEVFFATHDPTQLNRQGPESAHSIDQSYSHILPSNERRLKHILKHSMIIMMMQLSPRLNHSNDSGRLRSIIKITLKKIHQTHTVECTHSRKLRKFVRHSLRN